MALWRKNIIVLFYIVVARLVSCGLFRAGDSANAAMHRANILAGARGRFVSTDCIRAREAWRNDDHPVHHSTL